MTSVEVLYASRAYESRPVEGGFVLLRDLARSMVRVSEIDPAFLSVERDAKDAGVDLIGKMHEPEWGGRARLSFLRATWAHHRSFDVVHTAHVPTCRNVAFFRLLATLGRRSKTRYLQTITALPAKCGSSLERLCWGDHLVCQSETVRTRLEAEGISVSRVTPWPSPCRVAFDPERRSRTRKAKFSGVEKVVVFPGEFARLGLDSTFRECLVALLERAPPTCVVLACRHDESGIAKRIREGMAARHADRVLVAGTVDWIVQLLEAADLVIYPARTMEGKFQPPLVLLEALSVGVPVLASSQVDLPDEAIPELAVSRSVASWNQFGRHAARMLQVTEAGARTCNRYEETVQAYRRCYRELCS